MDFLSSFPTVIRNRLLIRPNSLISVIFGVLLLTTSIFALPPQPTSTDISVSPSASISDDIRVECANRHMIIHIMTGSSENRKYFESPSEEVFTDNDNSLNSEFPSNDHDIFNGLVYPKGLSRNSSCMAEYVNQHDPIIYKLPLRSCNTMSSETEDGGIEFFNTIVVQPHLKLVTNQGRGFHIRCKYETVEKMISYKDPVRKGKDPRPLPSIAELPRVSMKIFRNDPEKKRIQSVAENVKIGDPLAIVVEVEPTSNDFGIKVADCLVKDGLGWGEQRLTTDKGCPIDDEIMGLFVYNSNKTRAEVSFQAHKFPYTQSVYYQCNVKFCLKHDDQCQDFWNMPCASRPRRQTKDANDGIPATIEVFSGLYVNEATDLSKLDTFDDVTARKNPEDSICVSQKTFAIAISIAGFILMLCVVLAIIIILARRQTKKTSSVPGSSIYSGPYTNTAYSHTS